MVKAKVDEVMTSANLGDFEGFDGEDFGLEGGKMTLSQIPVLKLTQAMTPEALSRDFKDISAGMFMNDVTKEPLGEELEIRILRAWRCRAKFAPKDGGNTNIECSCPTFMDPEGDTGTEYGKCRTCPYNNFDVDDHCQTQFHMVVAIGDDPNNTYRIILAKSQYSLGKKLENALRAMGSRFPRIPVFCFKVKVSVDEKVATRHNSKYFVYKFDVMAPDTTKPFVPEEVKDEFLDTFKRIGELRAEAVSNHKQRIAEQASAPAVPTSTDTSTMFTEDVLKGMGTSVESTVDGGSEDIPF